MKLVGEELTLKSYLIRAYEDGVDIDKHPEYICSCVLVPRTETVIEAEGLDKKPSRSLFLLCLDYCAHLGYKYMLVKRYKEGKLFEKLYETNYLSP